MSPYARYAKSAKLGIGLLVGTLGLFALLFSKDAIGTALMSGRTIEATFQNDYKLRPNVSAVKVGYVKVGKVSDIERTGEGHARVSLKVDDEVLDKLGSAPTATIRSTTLLGGNYFVDLRKGGHDGPFRGDSIPINRTAEPVELDKVARALQPDALKGLQGTLGSLEASFQPEGRAALRRLLAAAPETLHPASRVLDAAQGSDADDLTHVVSGLEATGAALTRTKGQLESILTNLHRTSGTLSGHRTAVRQTLETLPASLDSTRTGLRDLDRSLGTLRDTSDDIIPVVRELNGTLETVQPVLRRARPVVSDARVLLTDARPLLGALVPSAKSADQTLEHLEGPVLNRLNGPVKDWLYADYKGSGVYELTHSGKPMYQEITYMLANLDRASGLVDRNGHAVAFQPGIGTGSIGGLPVSPEQLAKGLTSWLWPQAPTNTLGPVGPAPGTPTEQAPLGGTSLGDLGGLDDPGTGLFGGLLGGWS